MCYITITKPLEATEILFDPYGLRGLTSNKSYPYRETMKSMWNGRTVRNSTHCGRGREDWLFKNSAVRLLVVLQTSVDKLVTYQAGFWLPLVLVETTFWGFETKRKETRCGF